MHGLTHFFIHLSDAVVLARVVPVQTQAFGNLLNDPQIGFGLPRWINRLLAQLHHAVGVAHRPRLFRPSRRGQHHVSQPRGFGHENILNHQVL